MSDDYSMGAALDLAGRARELADSQNQAVEQAKGNVQQAQGRGAADKTAARMQASTAKLQAARAAVDAKLAAAERGFAVTKTLINFGVKLTGDVVGAISDRAANEDRARAAVEQGGAAMRRLERGGAHDKAITGGGIKQADLQAIKTDLQEMQNAIKGNLATGKMDHADIQAKAKLMRQQLDKMAGEAGALDFAAQSQLVELRKQLAQTELASLNKDGNPGTATGQRESKALRMEIMNLDAQAKAIDNLKDFVPQNQNVGLISVAVSNPDALPGEKPQANMEGYLKQQGMDERMIESFKQYNKLQEDMNEQAVAEDRNASNQPQSVGTRLQKTLDAVVTDQKAVEKMGPAAKFVDALDRMDNAKATLAREKEAGSPDNAAIAAAEKALNDATRDMRAGRSDFQSSRELTNDQKYGVKMLTDTGENMLSLFIQLQSLNKNYRDAQAQLSAASEKAGEAEKAANDMELS